MNQNMQSSKQQFYMGSQPSHLQTLNQSALSNTNMIQLNSVDINPMSVMHQSPTLSPTNANGQQVFMQQYTQQPSNSRKIKTLAVN